jgi:hypothetical protein
VAAEETTTVAPATTDEAVAVDADAGAPADDAGAATDLSIAAAGDLADRDDDDLPVGWVVVAALLAIAVTGAAALAWRRRTAA